MFKIVSRLKKCPNAVVNVPKCQISSSSSRYLAEQREVLEKNLYNVLGIHSSATQAEIKKAYYDLTKIYHPDVNEGSADAARRFLEVTEAYEVLSNYGLRKRYDRGLPLPAIQIRKPESINEVAVKYQKFYDRRIAKSSPSVYSSAHYEEKGEPHPRRYDLQVEERDRIAEEEFENSKKQQHVIAAMLCVWIVVVKIIYKHGYENHV